MLARIRVMVSDLWASERAHSSVVIDDAKEGVDVVERCDERLELCTRGLKDWIRGYNHQQMCYQYAKKCSEKETLRHGRTCRL